METRYCLEIYPEDDDETPGAVFYSNEPFLPIAAGDLMHPGGFEGWGREGRGQWTLEVVKAEHIIWATDKRDSKHKLCVYTRYVQNTSGGAEGGESTSREKWMNSNFIPIDLRDSLRAAANEAQRAGDTDCAGRLRQIAEYEGDEAPRRVRELGLQACELRYTAVRELMRLVRLSEAEG
ncbi:MAG: hypothetical protein ACREA0_03295 [bacterium]